MKQVWTKITCLNCQHEIFKIRDTYLNPNIDKSLKQKILNDEYFYEICPKCNHVVKSIYPCIYKDASKHLMIYLKENKVIQDKDYKQRYVTNVNDFKELIQIYEDDFDDRKIHILKQKLKIYCERQQTVNEIHYQGKENAILFFDVDGQLKGLSLELYDSISVEKEDTTKMYHWHL